MAYKDFALPNLDADEIVGTAVKEFALHPRPLRADITRLKDLALPLLPAMSDAGRRAIAAVLCESKYAPKSLLRALCDYPVAECASILTRSALLNPAELLAVISQHGAEHARAIARRADLPTCVRDALRALQDPGVDRALDLRQGTTKRAVEHAPAAPVSPPSAGKAFEHIQSVLQKDPAEFARPLTMISPETLTSLARDENPNLLHTAVADCLAITVASAAALCSNPGSKNLLHMLRFVGLSTADALDVFGALALNLAHDERVAKRFADVYEGISRPEAAAKVRAWRSDDLIALAREALAANDPGPAANDIRAGGEPMRLA